MTEGQQQRIAVGVVGATGYGGQELVRLLARHPLANLKVALGSSQAEQSRRLPGLARLWDGEITAYSAEALAGCDVVFLSTPEAFAATSAVELLQRGHRVIDLSGAFRLRDAAQRARFYPATPDPMPDGTLYSLPEFDGAGVPSAKLVSCPGCYPTAAMLSLLPLTRAGLLQGDAIVDAKSGISGAGKGANDRTHFSENHGSVAAYALFGHRHTPEMEQALGLPVTFTPHLVPLDRGILSTTYARLASGVTATQVAEAFGSAYANAVFVRLTGDRLPEIKHVVHTNFCDIGWKVDEPTGRVIVVAVLDNLLKGAAGQAVQQFNLLCGFPESEGLL
jgi:N-acetyl-gamma-glutamyl-phosphate reductase